jgi:hypothetical protein
VVKALLQRVLGRAPSEAETDTTAAPADEPLPPLEHVNAAAAREAHKRNPHASWAARSLQANQADRSLACHRIWTAQPDLRIHPKFQVRRDQAVFAVGSCFAREVEDALVELGFEVPTHATRCSTRRRSARSQREPGARPRAYLNRYNSMSMLDEFRHLLGDAPEIEQGVLTYPLDRGSAADLHYTQSLRQVDMATTLARRRAVREYLGPLLRRCKLYVITLGMAECWYDEAAGRYLNNTPGPRVLAAFGDRLVVHLTRFDQHRTALESLHQVLHAVHGMDFVVVTARCLSAVWADAGDEPVRIDAAHGGAEFAALHDNVDYFSYELVDMPTRAAPGPGTAT